MSAAALFAPYLAQAAGAYGITVDDLLARSRVATITEARDYAIALVKAGTSLADAQIAEAWGMTPRGVRKAITRHRRRAEAGDARFRFVDTLAPNGATVIVARRVSDIDRLVRDGMLKPAQRDAAADFAADFALVGYARIARAGAERLDRSPGAIEHARAAHLDRRARVDRAFNLVGGTGTELGECLWHVVGSGLSLAEWAARRLRAQRARDRWVLALACAAIAPVYGAEGTNLTEEPNRGSDSGRSRKCA